MGIIGRNIRRHRKSLNLSQAELAAYIGKSPSAVSQYEKGTMNPSMATIRSLAAIFGIAPSDLLDTESAPTAPADEAEVLALYRQLGKRDRKVLLATAKAMIEEGESL